MEKENRENILSRLRKAQGFAPAPKPLLQPMPEESMDLKQMVDKFQALVEAQTGVVYRVKGNDALLERLEKVLKEEGVSKALASTDSALEGLDLTNWGSEKGFEITTRNDYPDRKAFKKGAFDEVQAGITGVDFGFAESGTLCIIADKDNPRLTSLAPVLHIAVLPVDRLAPSYEHMAAEVFDKGKRPSQVFFITGPSMTADIQATPFKGMHGPRRLIVMLKED